jgi:hypothetical protein
MSLPALFHNNHDYILFNAGFSGIGRKRVPHIMKGETVL